MSKAPPQKPNLITTMMWMMLLFFTLQMFLNKPQVTDKRTAREIYTEMLQMNRDVKDISIQQLLPAYEQKLNEEKPQNLEFQKLKGQVLVANTSLRAGILRNDVNRTQLAFTLLEAQERKLRSADIWKWPVAVEPRPKFEEKELSAEQLFHRITVELDKQYKSSPIFGFFPGYQFIDALVALTGRHPQYSYALAALLLAIAVRALVWPMFQRQLIWSRQMQQLQPRMKELQDAFAKKDPSGAYKTTPEFQQKQMGLYKEYGINPMAGCLPTMIQIPFFLLVYQCMLHYRFEFSNGYFLWINPATSATTKGFFAANLGQVDQLLVIIYGVSMIVSTYLAPVSDPSNIRQQRMMSLGISILFTIMMMFFWPLPSAFVLYWIFINVLSTYQSLRSYRMPLPPLVKVNAPNGAVLPTNGNGTTNGVVFQGTGTPKVHKPKKSKKR